MTISADYQHINITRPARVLVVRLKRAAQRNAVNIRLHPKLAQVLTAAQRDVGGDVVLLTGDGSAFCAGGDIAWMKHGVDDLAGFERSGRDGKNILFRQLDLEKPLIPAQVNAVLAHERLSKRTAAPAQAVAALRERLPPRFIGR